MAPSFSFAAWVATSAKKFGLAGRFIRIKKRNW
jgi:hypothetical protein